MKLAGNCCCLKLRMSAIMIVGRGFIPIGFTLSKASLKAGAT
jgi:hypothetical protein